jgi:hypothetical protein
MRVCKAARVGVKEWLRRLPGFVLCGGYTGGTQGCVSEAWRLDLATLRWEPMPALVTARSHHACCTVRGTIVVLGGRGGVTSFDRRTSTVEMLSEEQGAFVNLQALSCSIIFGASAIAVEESDSAAGQVLLFSGQVLSEGIESEVHLMDLAAGTCTRQPDMLHARHHFATARLRDGRVVCAGGQNSSNSTAEVYGPPVQAAPNGPWTWKEMPAMSVGRLGCGGCLMSDGRFAVLGGYSNGQSTSSCEALVVGDDDHWQPLAPMHDSRRFFACAAVAGCVIVAGGLGQIQLKSTTRCWIGGSGFRATYLTTVKIS